MKPHPRIRKTVKWGGAAVTVLLVVVWTGSISIACSTPWGYEAIGWTGVVLFTRRFQEHTVYPPQGPHVYFGSANSALEFWRMLHSSTWSIVVPLWPAVVATLTLTAFAWRLDTLARRRARAGFCPKCNYNRTGLAAGAVCPECGNLPA